MGVPHKHADVIKAWADGAEIEFFDTRFAEHRWKSCSLSPTWDEAFAYRVKPEPKPDVVKTMAVCVHPRYNSTSWQIIMGVGAENVRFVFDGDTYALKHVELIK